MKYYTYIKQGDRYLVIKEDGGSEIMTKEQLQAFSKDSGRKLLQ